MQAVEAATLKTPPRGNEGRWSDKTQEQHEEGNSLASQDDKRPVCTRKQEDQNIAEVISMPEMHRQMRVLELGGHPKVPPDPAIAEVAHDLFDERRAMVGRYYYYIECGNGVRLCRTRPFLESITPPEAINHRDWSVSDNDMEIAVMARAPLVAGKFYHISTHIERKLRAHFEPE